MNYPFPFWGYPPPPPNNQRGGPNRRDIERAIDKAVKQAMRYRDQDKNNKRKRKEEISKKAAAAKARFFTNLEWYILGILMYPVVGPLYHMLINHITNMVK